MNPNATIVYRVVLHGTTAVDRECRGRVTEKRIHCRFRVYDRETGERVSKYRVGMMSMKLISYQLDGQPVVALP